MAHDLVESCERQRERSRKRKRRTEVASEKGRGKNEGDDREKKEIDHRPWSTPMNQRVREAERDREGEARRRRRRHSRLLLQALVRGGGRLGRLEGIPFQTLWIDLFVDGPPSLHPLLIVVDHVLKLFQRFSTGSPRFSIRFL